MRVKMAWLAAYIDRPSQRMEFGACHVRQGWRRHKTEKQKFLGLERAFATSAHRITKLLQEVDANPNAQNNKHRGQALYVAVWFSDAWWAILCNQTHATLIPCDQVQLISEHKDRSDATVALLKSMFEQSSHSLKRELDDHFFYRVISQRGA